MLEGHINLEQIFLHTSRLSFNLIFLEKTNFRRLNFLALKILNPNFEVLEKNMAGVEAKPLKKVNKAYKIRREGSFVSGFK